MSKRRHAAGEPATASVSLQKRQFDANSTLLRPETVCWKTMYGSRALSPASIRLRPSPDVALLSIRRFLPRQTRHGFSRARSLPRADPFFLIPLLLLPARDSNVIAIARAQSGATDFGN